ncbi:MAG: CHAT domain-containing tetratricopeptide repeat protein [Lentimicrobium sp.]|nr:CHAT domain-containing tetratricopeptide repeat protein [Lentimicrobium sp.]
MRSSKYDSALRNYESAMLILHKDKKWNVYFETLLKVVDIHRIQGKADSAEIILQEARLIQKDYFDDNKTYLADLSHREGLMFLDKGEFDSAVIHFNRSIESRVAATGANDTTLALTYNGLGTIGFFRSDYNFALENYNKAYTLASKRKNPEDADLSRYLQNIGIIYAQKGDYMQAEKTLVKSLTILEKITDPFDPDLANRYLNMGRLMALMNNEAAALPYYDKSEIILLKKLTPDHPDIGSLYQNKGQSYVHLGDYEKALLYFKKALSIAEKNYGPTHVQVLAINMNIGYALEKKEDYASALIYYKASIPPDENSEATIKSYSNLASLYAKMGNVDLAEEYYLKSIKLATEFLGESHPETALLYTRFGYFQLVEGRGDLGLKMFKQALSISKLQFGNNSREVSNNYTHLGTYYSTISKPSKSLIYFQNAILAFMPDFVDTSFMANPAENLLVPDRYLVNALNGKANALFDIAQAKDDIKLMNLSFETYKLSVKAVEKLRAMYQNEESKLQISDDERKTYLNTVKVAVELYRMSGDEKYAEQAFKYADKGKSAVLISSMLELEARQFGEIPPGILKLENQLKLDLGSYSRYIYEAQLEPDTDKEKIRFWEAREFELQVKYDSLILVLEKEYPEYHALKYKEPELDIQKIRDNMEPGRTFIEYALGDTTLYTFVLSKDKFEVLSKKINSQFRANIQTITSSTQSEGLMSIQKSDYLNYIHSAHALYLDLLAPVKKINDDKKLIIVPDGEIGYVSFDMLLTAAGDSTKMDFKHLPYLIYDHIISYSASAALQYSGLQNKHKKPVRNLLAMAPSYDNLTNLEKDGFVDETGNTVYLLPIPGVGDEIDKIRKILSGKSLVDEKATERAFKEQVADYNILHFAMHTLINNEKPMLSKLVFYQDGDTLEDGMLNTYELFGMDINAGLAVLSACNTGTGKLLKGEGIMNLARGFIYAGVPGIVMTMWSVEDQASAQIVTSFYKYLDKGMPKDEALRQAKLDMLAEGNMLRSHPYYWAAYVTIGDYSPMKFIKPLWMNILFAVIALSSIVLLLLMTFRKTRLHPFPAQNDTVPSVE